MSEIVRWPAQTLTIKAHAKDARTDPHPGSSLAAKFHNTSSEGLFSTLLARVLELPAGTLRQSDTAPPKISADCNDGMQFDIH